MGILSCLSCRIRVTAQASITTSPRFYPDSDNPADRPRPYCIDPIKASSSFTSRPIEDKFETPKRRQSLPNSISRPLSKLSLVPTAATWPTQLRISTRDTTASNKRKMSDTYNHIKRLIKAGVAVEMEAAKFEPFIPQTYAQKLLKGEKVSATLEKAIQDHLALQDPLALHDPLALSNNTSRLVSFIRNSAPQLFMLLVRTNCQGLLEHFCDNDFGDAMFPVTWRKSETFIESTHENTPRRLDLSSKIDFSSEIDLSSKIEYSDFSDLLKIWQWYIFAPKLLWTTFEHSSLDSQCKLPFLTMELKTNTGFSMVYKCAVHKDHINIDSGGLEIEKYMGEHPYVAVKRLLPSVLKKEDFNSFVKAEYDTLDLLRGMETEHLIKAAGFYKVKSGKIDDFYFVFPWAEYGNLCDFWETKIPAKGDSNYMKWVSGQLADLADAIRTLHHETENKKGGCRHGDLKPENVLCFKTSSSTTENGQPSYSFVLSDVGVSRIHDKSTQHRAQSVLATARTVGYAAPDTELFPNVPTSRRYDIWSLGCLYLEFIIWLLYGLEELKRFRGEIGTSFYTTTKVTTTLRVDVENNIQAQVNPKVKAWIEHIKKDQCAGNGQNETAIGRLIVLVEKRLLVVKATPDPKAPIITSAETGDEDIATINSTGRADIPSFVVKRPTVVNLGDEAHNNMMSQMSEMARFAKTDKHERAYAVEVCDAMTAIIQAAKAVEDRDHGIQWVNTENVSNKGPMSVTDVTTASGSHSLGINQELDDEWEYGPDESVAQQLRAKLSQPPEVYEPSELCGHCKGLAIWSPECRFEKTTTDLANGSAGCALCRLLSRSIKLNVPDENFHFFRVGSSLKVNNKRLAPIVSLYTLPVSEAPGPFELESKIQLGLPKLPRPGSPVHIDVLREWIRDCNTHQCFPSQEVAFRPTRLLHVGTDSSKQSCLICETGQRQLGPKVTYLALSHRWASQRREGEPDPLKGKTVCTYAKTIGTLKDGVNDSEFPPMYQDAIKIARELKVDYLWIDSLCIIQRDKDNPDDKDKGQDWIRESELMEDVFSSAYATLAASCAGSPADRFLIERPERHCVTMQKDKARYYLCDAIDDFHADVEKGELNKRGWVFQERALSRRTIYFTEKQTYWECGKGVRCETLTKTRNSKASIFGNANFPSPSLLTDDKGKQIELFQEVYMRYSKLDLTYPEDRPTAIRGLEKRLLSVLKSKGGYGIIDLYLHRSLLWQRDGPSLELISVEKNGQKEKSVPSWSWMAYAGDIKYDIPFGEVDWVLRDKDIFSPWKTRTDDDTASHELKVLVYDIKAVEQSALVIYDIPRRTFNSLLKCAIFGSSKSSNERKGRKYYTLLVIPLDSGEANVYQRAGVAHLSKDSIAWDNPTLASIR